MKKNIILVFFLILSIIVASVVLVERIQVESQSRNVDVILDYKELNELAKQSEHDIQWWIQNFKELGVQYVAINEESLSLLDEQKYPIEYMLGKDAVRNIELDKPYYSILKEYNINQGIGDYDIVVSTPSKETFDFIKKGLDSRYSIEKYDYVSSDNYYFIVLRGDVSDALFVENTLLKDSFNKVYAGGTSFESSKMIRVGLGFSKEKIDLVQANGLKVIPRPYSINNWVEEKYMNAVFEDFENYNMIPPVFIFGGAEVMGYPSNIDLIKNYMLDNDIKVGLIESGVQRGHIEQEGLNLLTQSLNYDAVRLFSLESWMQERFAFANYTGAEEIENMLYRAVTERNIRAIYFRPFKKNKIEYVTDFGEYEKMFNRFEERITPHGLALGESNAMPLLSVRKYKQVLMAWGIVAAGVFLLSHIFKLNNKVKYIMFLLGWIATPIAYVVLPALMEKVMALGAAIVFPSLGMLYFIHTCHKYYQSNSKFGLDKKIVIAIKELIIVSAISSLGALFVASILSNIEFLLEMDIFRGVKFSQLVPFIVYALIYLMYFGYNKRDTDIDGAKFRLKDFTSLMFENIKVYHLIIGGVLLVVGYIYIARTGHETNIQPSEMELILRNVLEENLLARPRTKEFLIAFPLLMTGIAVAIEKYKSLIFISGLITVIGQTSIVNTFSHLRTPVYLSFVRTIYSLGIGILFGLSLIHI